MTKPLSIDPSPADFEAWSSDPVHFSFVLASDDSPQFRPPSDHTLALYRLYWNAWLSFLRENKTPMAKAAALDVVAFLSAPPRQATSSADATAQPEPSKAGTSKDSKLSPTTKARYRRVLGRIYTVGVLVGAMRRNPFAETGSDVPRRELPKSEAIPSGKKDTEHAMLVGLLDTPWEDAQGARDRVLLCLQMLDGLTLAESIQATHQHLQPQARGYSLSVAGNREAQKRQLTLHPVTVQAIHHLGLFVPPTRTDPPSYLVPNLRHPLRPLLRHAAYKICSDFLDEAYQNGELTRRPSERGGTTLRNTAIAAWVNEGLRVGEVLRRAGLKRVDALNRLKNFMEMDGRHKVTAAEQAASAAGLPGAERYRALNRSCHSPEGNQ